MAPMTSGAGSSTSVPSMMAGHEVGLGDNIGAIDSTIFSAYSMSTGLAGVQPNLVVVIPSMVAPQPEAGPAAAGPLVIKKPRKRVMRPGTSNTARYVSEI
jgi:hypothetical protein